MPFPASGRHSARIRLCRIDEPRGDSRERIPKNAECKIAFGIFWYSRRESNPQLTLRRGLLYPFNYGSVLFPFRRRFSFYYIIRIKSNFLSRFISFCQNISHSCRNKRCAVTAAYGKRRNLFRTVARLKKKARQVFDLPRLFVERATRIGLATEAWEAPILPLNYARV